MPRLKLSLLFTCCALMLHVVTGCSRLAVKQIHLKQYVRIPVQFYPTQPEDVSAPIDSAKVMLDTGAEDDLPRGPNSFAVLEDGSFVIADPLLNRVVFYDSLGIFLDDVKINFKVKSLNTREDGLIELTDMDDRISILDEEGRVIPEPDAATKREAAQHGIETRFIDFNKGIIHLPHARNTSPESISIEFESDSTFMISLQTLAAEPSGSVFVALESSTGGSEITVSKMIRKYGADGRLLCQIQDIPLDYFVVPVDEFRIKNGRVYQLAPQRDGCYIRIWNTNQ